MDFSLMQPAGPSLINAISRKGIRRAGKGQEGEILPLLALTWMMKAMSGRGYNKMDHMDKSLQSHSIL